MIEIKKDTWKRIHTNWQNANNKLILAKIRASIVHMHVRDAKTQTKHPRYQCPASQTCDPPDPFEGSSMNGRGAYMLGTMSMVLIMTMILSLFQIKPMSSVRFVVAEHTLRNENTTASSFVVNAV